MSSVNESMKLLGAVSVIVRRSDRALVHSDELLPTPGGAPEINEYLRRLRSVARRRRLPMTGIDALAEFHALWQPRVDEWQKNGGALQFPEDELKVLYRAFSDFEAWLKEYFPSAFRR